MMNEADPLKRSPVPAPLYYPAPIQATAIKPIPRWIWIASALVILCIIGAAIPIYKIWRTQWRKADVIIASLHSKMIRGDDAAIFSSSDPAWRHDVGRTKSDAIFDFTRTQLGAPRSSTCINQSVSATAKGGTILTLTFTTVFDKGTGTETLRMRKSGNYYSMVGYNIRSPLITKESIPPELRAR